MAIIRWQERSESGRPQQILDKLHREVNRLVADIFSRESLAEPVEFPAANITGDDKNLYLRCEMAGIRPEAVEILVEDQSVTIRGERKMDAEEGVSFHRRERGWGRFDRIIALPSRVDPERGSAAFKDGILTISLPQVKATSRKIEIEVE